MKCLYLYKTNYCKPTASYVLRFSPRQVAKNPKYGLRKETVFTFPYFSANGAWCNSNGKVKTAGNTHVLKMAADKERKRKETCRVCVP